jgi:excisionase family DNA binding protein
MIKRRDIGAKTPTVAGIEDELIRLVRVLAREAAQEAFAVLLDALEGHPFEAPSLANHARLTERGSDSSTMNKSPSSASGERSLSVQEAAARANVSEKTIRRKVKSGELPARRFGKLLRIKEFDLFPCPPGDSQGAAGDE